MSDRHKEPLPVPSTSCEKLVSALRILARDINSEDGVANAAIAEAAERLDRYHEALEDIRDVDGTAWYRSIARDAIGKTNG